VVQQAGKRLSPLCICARVGTPRALPGRPSSPGRTRVRNNATDSGAVGACAAGAADMQHKREQQEQLQQGPGGRSLHQPCTQVASTWESNQRRNPKADGSAPAPRQPATGSAPACGRCRGPRGGGRACGAHLPPPPAAHVVPRLLVASPTAGELLASASSCNAALSTAFAGGRALPRSVAAFQRHEHSASEAEWLLYYLARKRWGS